jgi:hypothetical protein
MRVVPFYMLQVIFVILVAYLTVSMITVRYRLRNIAIMGSLDIKVGFELPLKVLFIFFLSLFNNFVEFFSDEL